MLVNIIAIVASLTFLIVGADWFVRAASGLAHRLGLPQLLIGLTIVAFGTSAPELMVSLSAALEGEPGIALGNIAGSNVANVFLVLGAGAFIRAIPCGEPGLGRNVAIMLVATAGFAVLAYGPQSIGFSAGVALALGLIAYLASVALRGRSGMEDSFAQELLESDTEHEPQNWPAILSLLIAGFAGLIGGAHFLVQHGAELAERLGVRDEVIGLTVVALGTSLPELTTVVVAALQRRAGIALGGIVGSNLFNILAVGGVVGLAGGAAFSPEALVIDVPWMVLAALALAPFVFMKRQIGRGAGGAFLVLYVVYIGVIVLSEANGGAGPT